MASAQVAKLSSIQADGLFSLQQYYSTMMQPVHASLVIVIVTPAQKTACSAGEVFGGISVPAGGNDTQHLLQALAKNSVQSIVNCLRGPWAAVYWDHCSRTLWFGKDVLGMSLCHVQHAMVHMCYQSAT